MPFYPYNLHSLVQPQTYKASRIALPARLPLPIARNLAIQCCRAVAFVHSAGYLHRDVKCKNFLLTREGVVKLCDFGQATRESDPKLNNTGTKAYRAPELCLGRCDYSYSADVYSLGLVIFEIVCGRPLLTASSEIELLCQMNEILGPLCVSQTLREAPDYPKLHFNEGFEFQGGLRKVVKTFFPEAGKLDTVASPQDQEAGMQTSPLTMFLRQQGCDCPDSGQIGFSRGMRGSTRDRRARAEPPPVPQSRSYKITQITPVTSPSFMLSSPTQRAREEHLLGLDRDTPVRTPEKDTPPRYQNCAFLDLLSKMLHPDPDSRITALEALSHPFLQGVTATTDTVGRYLRLLDAGPRAAKTMLNFYKD